MEYKKNLHKDSVNNEGITHFHDDHTRNTIALILAGGRGSRLQQLTDWRSKPAVPFGGKFRIIDFPLSNCVNSGVRRIGVVTQYKAQSLIRHIQHGWSFLDGRFKEFVELLPAQQRTEETWYQGTADAVYQNLDILRRHDAEQVLILGGDHIYKMDYSKLLSEHREKSADMTVACLEIPVEDLMPRIGDYDKWAIQWGYSKFPQEMEAPEEKALLSQMVVDSVGKNPRLWFGGEGRDFDPRSQTEDLGDNSMEASMYGILNLQRIAPCIKEWVKENDSDDYANLDQIYKDLVDQYSDYIFHVSKNIGGIYVTPKTMGEEGEVYRPVDKHTQKQALAFLNTYIFQEPKWLMRNDILNAIQSPQSKESITKTMESVMINLLGGSRISRMTFISERYADENPYRPEEYIDDLNQLVWGDMNVFYQTNSYRRKLQKSYVSNMIALYKPDVTEGMVEGLLAELSKGYTSNTDVRSLALDNLLTLQGKIKRTIPVMTDRLTIAHLNYLKREIEAVVGETDDVDPLFIPFRKEISIKEEGKE